MVPWWEKTLDLLSLFVATTFTVISIGHVATMWQLRKTFSISVRSPLLACTSGLVGTVYAFVAIFDTVLVWTPVDEFTFISLTAVPLLFTLYIGSYIMRCLRLLVVYDPAKRRRCGQYLKEKSVYRAMLTVTATIEIAVWSAALVYGIPRASEVVATFGFLLELLLVITSAAFLSGKLKKVDDMFNMSWEILFFGVCALLSLVLYVPVVAVPMPDVAIKYCLVVWVVVATHLPVTVTNIIPVRQVSGQDTHQNQLTRLFPCAPWRRIPRGTGAPAAHGLSSSRSTSYSVDSIRSTSNPLSAVMGFRPLLSAFEDFCRKALCSESLEFLIAVLEFKDLIHATRDSGGDEEFNAFTRIVDEYIKSNSPSEVNISGAAKSRIVKYVDRGAYTQLSLSERGNVLAEAEKQVSQLLIDNVWSRFRSSSHYKQITGELPSVNLTQQRLGQQSGSRPSLAAIADGP